MSENAKYDTKSCCQKSCASKFNAFLVAVAIGAGLYCVGSGIENAAQYFVDRDRVVTVKGLAEQQVMATEVIWPISFAVLTNDVNDGYTQMDQAASKIQDFLTKAGIDSKSIGLSTIQVEDDLANGYGDKRRPERYRLRQTVTVFSEDVPKVVSLMARENELLLMGVNLDRNYEYSTQFSYTKLNDIKPAMIETATKNAREVAMKFASDSGSTLGKIRSASQGQFSITPRDRYTPYQMNVRVVTTVEYYLKD